MKRFKPRKTLSPIKAIREHCIECMGGRELGHGYRKRVAECSSIDCALHDFRFERNPFRKQKLTKEQKEERARRLIKTKISERQLNKTSQNRLISK